MSRPVVGIARHTLLGPLGRGVDQGLLDGVLGRVEVAEAPGEHADDLRHELAQQVVDRGGPVQGQSSPDSTDIT
jgi:hypothetical protein